jgi:hypothetical protein
MAIIYTKGQLDIPNGHKTGIPNGHKIYVCTKWLSNIPNGHKICQHFSFQGPGPPVQTQIGILGLKIYHLATLVSYYVCFGCLLRANIFGIVFKVGNRAGVNDLCKFTYF